MNPLIRLAVSAADLIRQADGLLVTAGAGMGIDSGLPDFRGPQGFWGVYPALGRARIQFEEIACPRAFEESPRLAWGFYGHRLNLYRRTRPHDGYRLIREIGSRLPGGIFVFTSNVDGHFQKAGFSEAQVCEVHGSIHHLQCQRDCRGKIWPASGYEPVVDEDNCLLTSDPPLCPHCGNLARPNILMFGDWEWQEARQARQMDLLRAWLSGLECPVVVELGAGTAIPTVRRFGESIDGPLIRINRLEHQVRRSKDIGIPLGALEALDAIANELNRRSQ